MRRLLLLALLTSVVKAQDLYPRLNQSIPRVQLPVSSGLLTDRISKKQLKRWQEIERFIFVKDTKGQPLYRMLVSLWNWVETSGHAVHIEIVHQVSIPTCTAGSFSIEHFDPNGERHIAVIRLYLPNIDNAYIGPETARPDGYIPFAGLNKIERYAEVLGHELAHAVDILSSLERVRYVQEIVEQTNEFLLSRFRRTGSVALGSDLRRRLVQRDSLLQELETRAELMEAMIWRELIAGRSESVSTDEAVSRQLRLLANNQELRSIGNRHSSLQSQHSTLKAKEGLLRIRTPIL
jgi:hypothetical protein